MIPEFDENGNLPTGIHSASIEEVVTRFGGPSQVRQMRTTNLMLFYNLVKDFAVGMYIDGSYTTSKLSPGDIDIILMLPSNFNFKSSPQSLRVAQIIINGRTQYQLHTFAIKKGVERKKFRERFDWFTREKNSGEEKGIIYVECEK